MAENINAYCKICGAGYHVCNTCSNQKTFKPWRTVVDSPEHFLIYSAIHGYTISNNKEQAKSELEKCDLSGLENFRPEIKSVIEEIMIDSKKNKKTSKNINIEEIAIEVENNITKESNNDVE